MRIAGLEVRLSPDNLRELLPAVLPAAAGARIAGVTLAEGLASVRLQVEGLGIPIPVELAVRVAAVADRELRLHIDVKNMELVPEGLRQGLLETAAGRYLPPGAAFREGQLILDLGRLMGGRGIDFTLQDVTIHPDHVTIRLAGVAVPLPPAPGLPRATGTDAAPAPEDAGAVTPPETGPADGVPRGELVPAREVGGAEQHTYDRIRTRIGEYLNRTLPGWLQPAAKWLMLLPDLFVLLVRLARDERVSRRAKLLAAAAVAYVALSLDVVPDIIPAVGLLDDLALVLLALESLVGLSPPAVVRELWPGSEDVLEVIREGLDWARRYYPSGLMRRLRQWLDSGDHAGGSGPGRPGG